ncbi:MAG: metallophosphoesterase [Desulfobacterota bacterium]|nr:metallophosphoesterase [Thermodesulfobacteriota bacterium]
MRLILWIGIAQSILFLGHGLLYRTLVSFYGVADPVKLWTLRVSLALLSISFIGSSLLSSRFANLWVRALYILSASWLGLSYLLFLASALGWILHGLKPLFPFPLNRKAMITLLFGIALAGGLYGFINASVIRIQTIDLPLPHLPAVWEGRKAVWVSDLHLGHVRHRGFAQRLTEILRHPNPDIVFIGGDLFDGAKAMDLSQTVAPFLRLRPPLGTYFITGNHEEFGDRTPFLEAVRSAGIRVLDNEKMEIDGLQILGVGYRDSRNQKQFQAMLRKMEIDPKKPSLLLKHVPSDLEIAREQGISAQLSGHTHRGQVFLFRFLTSWIYKGYDYGLKRYGDLLVYTSSGVGTWGPPLRIDSEPEIVVIQFKRRN